MSYNGSGTFLINSAGQPVVANTVISATVFNALTADLATGLSTCITKDGQTTVTANIPFGNNKITALGAGTAASDAANLGQVQSTAAKLVTVTGTDTITGTMSPALTAYAAGQLFYFIANAANTGAVTINIDGLGAKSITRDGSTALTGGDINSGEFVVIIYDGTRFQMINAANSFGNTTINGTLTVTGNTALQANVSITSTLSVGGTFAVTGAATLGSTLAVTGKSDLPTVSTASINAAVALITTGTVTNLTASGASIASANIGNLQFTAASIASINAGVAVVTNLTATSASIASMNAGVALLTTATVTSLTATGASVASANVGTAVVTGLTVTGASIASVNAGTATLSGNLTLNGGTANGVLYLNGSKVATSGSALTFDGSTLTNTGNSTGTIFNTIVNTDAAGSSISDERIVFAMGGSLGFGITGWANAGIVEAASTGGLYLGAFNGPINFASGASARNINMTLTASGNLGIGTTSPANALEISRGAGVAGGVSLRGNGNSAAAEFFVGQGSGSDAFLYNRANATMIFGTNNATRMTLDSSGNLGIGTTSPGTRLEVRNDTTNLARVRVTSSATTAANYRGYEFHNGSIFKGGLLQDQSTDEISIFTPIGGNSFRVDTNGNLGLGVTPSGWDGTAPGLVFGTSAKGSLSYAGGATSLGDNFYRNSIGYRYVTTAAVSLYQASAGTHAWYNAPSGTAGNAITFTQAMTLDASGNLGVGTTSPATRLEVAGASPILRLTDTTNPVTGGVYAALEWKTSDVSAPGGIVSKIDCIDDLGLYGDRGALRFFTHNSSSLGERARITAAGELLVGVTSATANGGVIQVSNGITFPATQSASSNANTLDDYEEGTWSPSLGGNATYTVQSGTYTKIGRQVTVTAKITVNVLGTGSTTTISGLPFTNSNTDFIGSAYWHTSAVSLVHLTAAVNPSGTTVDFYGAAAATGTLTQQAIFQNGTICIITITYFV